MSVLKETRDRMLEVCREEGIDLNTPVRVRRLSPDEAIGTKVDEGFVLCRGREVIIEATVDSARGQAFTDEPSSWSGTLEGLFAMPLDVVRNRAVVVATLNALAAKLGLANHTIHCHQDDPVRCGRELVRELVRRFPDVRKVLLVGLQPGILEALVERFKAGNMRVVDLDVENIGKVRKGVRVGNGAADITDDVGWCELMLVTGSSVVNGTLDRLLSMSQDAARPLVFFGNTIAAIAAVADLERICPFGQDAG